MKIIHVIPISRGILLDHLSYFTATDVALGTLVLVPLRKKMIHAIVVGTENVSSAKSEIKSSTFALRKMEHTEEHQFLTPEFMSSVEKTAEYFISSVGSTLNALIPSALLKNLKDITVDVPEKTERPTSSEKLVLQADDEERFSNYKSLIREEFAKGSSVFICLPTIEDIKKAEIALEKGIEKYTYIFHSDLKKSEFVKLWKKIIEEKHPVLVIATGQYLCIPRKDIGTIVVEKEGSRAYKMQTRPFVDIRTFAEIYAKKIGARLILGDTLLRTETIWRLKNDEFLEFATLKFRAVSSTTDLVVDTRKEKGEKEIAFKVVSPELHRLIEWSKERKEHLFIFGVRKGFAPLTLCGDCGTITRCSICSTPVVLHADVGENFFQCHTCGRRRSAKEKCLNCTSWKLVTLGIGVELIEKEIRDAFPDIDIFKMDSHSVTTHKKAVEVARKFYATPGSVLVGTEMAIMYLDKKIPSVAVASIDSLFSLPDFRVGERVLSILLKIRALATEHFVLQTRDPEQKIFDYAIKGNLADFYRAEIEERKNFGYPPFSTFIKITLQGEEKAVETEMKKIPDMCEPYETDIFPAFTSKVRGRHVMHALVKVPQDRWPDARIVKSLRSLPPQFLIKVDPESIL